MQSKHLILKLELAPKSMLQGLKANLLKQIIATGCKNWFIETDYQKLLSISVMFYLKKKSSVKDKTFAGITLIEVKTFHQL